MTLTLSALEKGHIFPATKFELDHDWVRDYIDAVGDEVSRELGIVPPMALAALSIRALLAQSGLPAGAIHVGQDLSFHRPVARGESLVASAEVTSRGERQGWVLMSIAMRIADSAALAMEGKATITFPLDEAEV
jgi:acyl dehydratase